MTKIQYASDLHLEFTDNARYLKEHPLEVAGEILVLAGNTGYLGKEYSRHPFWDWAADNYRQVVVIPGNHEFYGGFDPGELHDGWTYRIRPNVACHYNDVLRFGDTELIVSTLWGYIRIEDAFVTQGAVSDFRRIRYKGKPLDWVRFNEEHCRCFRFLNEHVQTSDAKHIVVATHHLPSYELMSEDFKRSSINGAFAVELGGFIAASPVEYWIYGHSHRNIDTRIGRTQCVSNQLGYVSSDEHRQFDPARSISV